MKVTESMVHTATMILLMIIAVICLARGEFLGALGSALGALQAWSARWYLVKLKPSALVE